MPSCVGTPSLQAAACSPREGASAPPPRDPKAFLTLSAGRGRNDALGLLRLDCGVLPLSPGPVGYSLSGQLATGSRSEIARHTHVPAGLPGATEAAWPRLHIRREGATLDVRAPGDPRGEDPGLRHVAPVELPQYLQPSRPPRWRPWCRGAEGSRTPCSAQTHRTVNIIHGRCFMPPPFGVVFKIGGSPEHRAILKKAAGPSSRQREEEPPVSDVG